MHGVHSKTKVMSFCVKNEDYELAVEIFNRSTNGYESVHDMARAGFLKQIHNLEYQKACRAERRNSPIQIAHCVRCGYDWKMQRGRLPRICPNCQSPRWQKHTPGERVRTSGKIVNKG